MFIYIQRSALWMRNRVFDFVFAIHSLSICSDGRIFDYANTLNIFDELLNFDFNPMFGLLQYRFCEQKADKKLPQFISIIIILKQRRIFKRKPAQIKQKTCKKQPRTEMIIQQVEKSVCVYGKGRERDPTFFQASDSKRAEKKLTVLVIPFYISCFTLLSKIVLVFRLRKK